MTRTLFVGEPTSRDTAVYEVVAAAQQAAVDAIRAAAERRTDLPDGRAIDALARAVIDTDGRWPAYGHGLGHGIGLATHEEPRRPCRHRPSSPWSPASTSRARPGCGSRIWCIWMRRPGVLSCSRAFRET
jgi:Xaa-Pro aminopeptidase